MSSHAASRWGGIIPPLVTPLLDQDVLDRSGLERLIEHVIGGGVSGLFLLGTTGEGPSLSYRLREEMVRESCRIAGGRVRVAVCISDTSWSESVRFAGVAADAGADAAVVPPPYYFPASARDLRRYLERLAAASPLPLLLYNFPQLTKLAWDVETVRAAAQNEKIAGMKDSSGDVQYFRQAIEATRDRRDFDLLIGPENALVEALSMGASGGVCGGANLIPRVFVGIYEAARKGDWDVAELLQAEVRGLGERLYTVGEPTSSYLRGLKAALSDAGICSEKVALPFGAFTAEEQAEVRKRALAAPRG